MHLARKSGCTKMIIHTNVQLKPPIVHRTYFRLCCERPLIFYLLQQLITQLSLSLTFIAEPHCFAFSLLRLPLSIILQNHSSQVLPVHMDMHFLHSHMFFHFCAHICAGACESVSAYRRAI